MSSQSILLIVLVATGLMSCGVQRAQIGADAARNQIIGLSQEQILACMGTPVSKEAKGTIEVWTYGSNGTAVSASQPTSRSCGKGTLSVSSAEIREAFHNAVWLYADWIPSLPEPIVHLGGTCRSMSAVCGLVAEFNDRLPDHVFDRLMIYMRDIRYTLLRQKIFAEHSYAEGGRCFLRLIEDRKRQRR